MKKVLAIALAFVMLFSFAACSGSSEPIEVQLVDLSKYPAELSQWSAQNLIDYFTEAGVFTEGKGKESWLQDHEFYWIDTPVNECAGYWNETGSILIMCFTFDDTLPDTKPEDVAAMIETIKEKHQLEMELDIIPIDHFAGNIAFSFSYTTDDAYLNAAEEAYNNLVTALGVTPDF